MVLAGPVNKKKDKLEGLEHFLTGQMESNDGYGVVRGVIG